MSFAPAGPLGLARCAPVRGDAARRDEREVERVKVFGGRGRGGETQEPEGLGLTPLASVPDAVEPARFLGASTIEQVSGYVFLRWSTAAGVLCVAYPTSQASRGEEGHVTWVLEADPTIVCLLKVAKRGFQAPDGPDVFDLGGPKGNQRLLWGEYSRVIGQPAPYWPWGLEHEELISAWQPGDEPVFTTPRQEVDMDPLLRMAVLYPEGSATRRVLMHYYLRSIHDSDGTALVRECFTDAHDQVAFRGLEKKLVVAAWSVEHPAPGNIEDDLGADALRAVFAELLGRRDTLAVTVVQRLFRWSATKWFPFAHVARLPVDECAVLEEWTTQLRQVPVRADDTRFGYFMSTYYPRVSRWFIDPVTDAPVVEVFDARGKVEEFVTLLPRRLPLTSPLAAVTVDHDGHFLWVRTADGILCPAPGGHYGVAWGYQGSGIGPLIERLLDDITTEPIDHWVDPSPNELTHLTLDPVPNGTTYTRAQLETARAKPWQRRYGHR
uniref:hypothetical protein n=1 Tax=Actinokineospora sp. CA-119265 TaxID=3239890 RepID=UPI003F49431B